MRRTRLSATLATLALTATLAGTATATAAPPAADAAAPPCVKGYVCVQPLSGFTTLIPEGSRQDFNPPLPIVSVVNSTSTGYCLTGTYNRGVAPGQAFEPMSAYSLRAAAPSPDGFCLTTED